MAVPPLGRRGAPSATVQYTLPQAARRVRPSGASTAWRTRSFPRETPRRGREEGADAGSTAASVPVTRTAVVLQFPESASSPRNAGRGLAVRLTAECMSLRQRRRDEAASEEQFPAARRLSFQLPLGGASGSRVQRRWGCTGEQCSLSPSPTGLVNTSAVPAPRRDSVHVPRVPPAVVLQLPAPRTAGSSQRHGGSRFGGRTAATTFTFRACAGGRPSSQRRLCSPSVGLAPRAATTVGAAT
jgi:hypothetical protein